MTLPVPTKEGYEFKGWYLDSEFATEYNFSTPVTSDLVIYAKWEETTSEASDIKVYLGAIGNATQQDVPAWWEDYGFDIPTRATHYLDYMKSNDTRSFEEAALIGQHHLTWQVRTPLGLDAELSEAMGEDIIVSETDLVYPAVALPSDYKVTVWSTDAENNYVVADTIDSVDTPEGYTIYYVENAAGCQYGNTINYYITIAKK